MPLMEYRCRDCGRVTEFLEKADSEDGHECDECGGKDMEKLFSAFSAQVKQSAPASRCETCEQGTCPMRR